MKRPSLILAASAATIAALLFMNCANPASGNGSDIGNGITGILCNSDGSRAKDVKVTFIPVSYNPKTGSAKHPIDSTRTNDTGAYHFKSLPSDTYNILCGETKLSYRDSIVIGKSMPVIIPADTLKAPGSISGVIRLQPGDDSRTVFILFLGTNIWQTPGDEIGNFKVGNLAEGTYRVRLLTTTPNYQVMDTGFSIKAGIDGVLRDTIRLRSTGIPVPTGLKGTYDSLAQIVTLCWDRADTGLVKGYCVYRSNVDQNTTFDQINHSLVTDTVYRDTTADPRFTFAYKICSVDRGDNKGKLSAGVTVKMPAVPPVIMKGPRDTTLKVGDTITFTVSLNGSKPFRVTWYKGIIDSTTALTTSEGPLFKEITGISDSGTYRCVASNAFGSDTSEPFHITVTGDRPVITKEPRDTTLIENAAGSFTVSASGSKPFAFVWYKDIVDSAHIVVMAETLFIREAQLTQGGIYKCVVSNEFGSDTGRGFRLTVSGIPPEVMMEPSDTILNTDDWVQIYYCATGTRPFTSAWFKDGNDSAFSTDSVLRFSPIKASDSGVYRYVVRNDYGADTSRWFRITVTGEMPAITKESSGTGVSGSGFLRKTAARKEIAPFE